MGALQWFEILIGGYVLWVILACGTLLLDRRSPTATLAWIFAFIAIPFVSGIYYLMFGPRRLQRRRRRYTVARGSVARGIAGEHDADAASQLKPDAAGLAAVARRLEQGDATFASAVTLLDDGDATMKALRKDPRDPPPHPLRVLHLGAGWVGTHFRDLLAASESAASKCACSTTRWARRM
jgi:cardiolipin synthase